MKSSEPAERVLWEATAVAAPALPRLRTDEDAEVAVVGAGFAGLACAVHLAERGVRTIVLEAAAVGAGASGRCGGQLLYGGRHTAQELKSLVGAEAATRLHRFAAGAADAAFALIERLGLNCDAQRGGSIYAADTEAGLAEVRHKLQALQAAGIAALPLDREQLAERIGSTHYLGGYFNPGAGSVQPLSLVRELARTAGRAGARIFEHSPVQSIERVGSDWLLRTSVGQARAGRVRARRVLLATNGRSGWPGLEREVIPVWSFQVATDPLPAGSGALTTTAVVSDTRRLLRYFRRDAAGRLLMGGKGTLRGPLGPRSFSLQRRAVASLFPQLDPAAITWWWGGQVSVTRHRLPRLLTLGDGLFAHIACNGKGVAWNLALGPALAGALCGAPLASLPLPPAEPLQGFPLHGLQQFYSAAGSAWLRWRDGLDGAASA